jgi:hypothetical protein
VGIGYRWKALGVSALTFAVCFSALTGLRGWHLEPPPDVQSLVVNGTALLFLATTAYRGYHGREFIESWILVFGASVAFTLNLFIPVTRGGLLTLSGYSLVAAVLLASVLTALGFFVGYAVRTVQRV